MKSGSAAPFWISIIILCLLVMINGIATIGMEGGYERDREALLAIKARFQDPMGVTSTWSRNSSVPLCRWRGVTCGRKHRRVTGLHLSNQNLGGSLSPYIGNLSFLSFIDLQHNRLSGGIPPEIGRLSRLRSLLLSNNSLGGTIPANLSRCSRLITFGSEQNNHVGRLPVELGSLLKLETLSVYNNFLTGQLPASVGNLSNLQILIIGSNSFRGRLPDTLGQLQRLVILSMGLNKLFGLLPPSLYNISSLEVFSLPINQFHGRLPEDIGFTLVNVKAIHLGGNNFSGNIPHSLSNASKLEKLSLPSNMFTGKVSIDSKGKNISRLNMELNSLGSGLDDDLDFVKSLTNCSSLDTLALSGNQFGGKIPDSLTNLSTTITWIGLAFNRLTGTIPLGIANLVNLFALSLNDNRLTGPIPQAIGNLKNLQALALGRNGLSGRIPTSLGNLSRLIGLGLEENQLEGSIPAELGKCQQLTLMVLRANRLTGCVPKEIFSIQTLSVALDLSRNFLTGTLPLEVGNLKTLVTLYISHNKLSGQIPNTLGSCVSLEKLYLGGNHFNGSIPASLSSLKSMVELDVSSNNLSGSIPEFLETLSLLKYLNLSYNHFEGQVPTKGVFSNATAIALAGNGWLCGGISELHLPTCHFNQTKEKNKGVPLKVILIICGVLGIIVLLSTSLLFCWWSNRRVIAKPSSIPPSRESILMVSFQQLLKATDGFASANLIGQGSFGRVYRGVLLNRNQERDIVAVKVINLQEQGASKSFVAECNTLRNVRHRNLVRLISACSSVDFQGNPFKALIYEFMPNGSLEQWLHPSAEANGEHRVLDFLERLNIAIDVVSALDYLHNHCKVAVVHCDLKPSNILLDRHMVAHVGDFGLARFFPKTMNNLSGKNTLGFRGTIGYVAPEYGIGTEATTSGDMYSFGILLLEMFTGKRPIDDMFGDGLTIHHFTKMALPDQLLEVVDPLLLARDNEGENIASSSSSRNPNPTNVKECLISILKVGIASSVESPKDRMDSVCAAKQLHFIRAKFLGTAIPVSDTKTSP